MVNTPRPSSDLQGYFVSPTCRHLRVIYLWSDSQLMHLQGMSYKGWVTRQRVFTGAVLYLLRQSLRQFQHGVPVNSVDIRESLKLVLQISPYPWLRLWETDGYVPIAIFRHYLVSPYGDRHWNRVMDVAIHLAPKTRAMAESGPLASTYVGHRILLHNNLQPLDSKTKLHLKAVIRSYLFHIL